MAHGQNAKRTNGKEWWGKGLYQEPVYQEKEV